MSTRPIYRKPLALLTDLYQLTMAQGYWKAGMHRREAVFNLFFRQHPFKGGYTLACGLARVGEFLDDFRITEEDTAYLAGLTGVDDKPLFQPEFLDYLVGLKLTCQVMAVREGTAVFPNEPIIRVRGPIIECQLLETALLNIVNFQTLIATKAARISRAAQGDPILEFGLRRAQGIDGSLSGAYAAYVGGCHATSNVLAGKLFGIPVKGTHAHSWVMAFDSEDEAFETYAEAMPNNCVFLVDTYDTLAGVRKAVRVGRQLAERGYQMYGIRLDSGDLAQLSIEARAILDEAGFPEAHIVASNDLDEYAITELKLQGARVDTWGVGTRLITAYDQPALGGVYKLSAMCDAEGRSQPRLKLSEEKIKISNPGTQQIRRLIHKGKFVGDVLYEQDLGYTGNTCFVDDEAMTLPEHDDHEDLLIPLFAGGRLQREPDTETARNHAAAQLAALPESVTRLEEPAGYTVGLDPALHSLKQALILTNRRN